MLKPSHADAAQSAVGLLAFSTVVSDYWGSTDYTGTDLQNDDAFLSWLGRFEGAIPTYGDEVNTPLSILLAQPRLDVVGTTVAEVNQEAGAQMEDLVVSSAERATASTGRGGGGRGRPRRRGRGGLAGLDHRSGRLDRAVDGRSTTPTGTGLPPPDVMIALRDLWQGVAKR